MARGSILCKTLHKYLSTSINTNLPSLSITDLVPSSMATLAISNKPWNSNGGNSYLPCQTQTSSTATWHLQGMHFFLDSFHNLFQGLGSSHRCIHPPSAKAMEPRISILEYLGGGGLHPLRFFKYYTSLRNWDFLPYLSSHFTGPALLPSCLDRPGHTLKLLRLEKHQF